MTGIPRHSDVLIWTAKRHRHDNAGPDCPGWPFCHHRDRALLSIIDRYPQAAATARRELEQR